MRKILLTVFIVLFIAFTGAYIYLQPAPLPVDKLLAAKQKYDVRILRDKWGVPHIFGKTDADVAYGLAYAHAEDDFATTQGALLAARGQLAAEFGKDAAPNDYMVQLLRIRDVVETKYETDLRSETRAICEAYADGLNYYAALHPDDAIAALYPVNGEDIVVGFLHKMPLFFGLDRVLRELFAPERKREISKRVMANSFFFPKSADSEFTRGSNTFAVAPSRSADGKTRLAINSHQPWEGPVAWYEVHLKSEEGWDTVGGLFPGSPVILHGHNRNLGWAHTVNKPDLIDVYVLEINPENPDQYKFDGEWKELDIRKAPIRVKLFGPFYWTVEREVLWSIHGPVVRQPHGTYAIRIAGYGRIGQIEQWHRMNKATNFDEWLEAMKIGALPIFNTGYADREGNIYYVYNALLPIRSEGYDWSKYLPGNTSQTLWTTYLPFENLPQVKNPASGFIQNCNNSPFHTTTGPGNPDPANYASTFGIETKMTNRALRALELFGFDESITAKEFYAYKYDLKYSKRSALTGILRMLLNVTVSQDTLLQNALNELKGWELRTDKQSAGAALAILSFYRYFGADLDTLQTSTLLANLKKTAQTLQQKFNRLDVPWGEVNRLIRGDVDLPVDGGPDVLRAVYGRLRDDGRLQGRAGDCYVLMVEWDQDGKVHSQSIHQYGSATLNKLSPHYADQARRFANTQMKPVWMDEADIRANLEAEYHPGEHTRSDSAKE